MTTLFIDRRDAVLQFRDGTLSLHFPADDEQAARVQRFPVGLLERIVAVSRTELDTATLAALAEAGISLTALGGRRGDRVAHVEGSFHNDARVRIGQSVAYVAPRARLRLARLFVGAKLREQRRALRLILARRADLRKPLMDALATNGEAGAALRGVATLAELRGLEGAAAAAYFRGFFHAFPPSLAPQRRLRRPPPDPVNATLSLAYTLGSGLAVRAARIAGLDPAIGYLHAPAHGRLSLGLDLVEIERASLDLWVWRLFADRVLQASHFGREGSGACLLAKTGRANLYQSWSGYASAAEMRLLRAARLLARHLSRHAPAPETYDDELSAEDDLQ